MPKVGRSFLFQQEGRRQSVFLPPPLKAKPSLLGLSSAMVESVMLPFLKPLIDRSFVTVKLWGIDQCMDYLDFFSPSLLPLMCQGLKRVKDTCKPSLTSCSRRLPPFSSTPGFQVGKKVWNILNYMNRFTHGLKFNRYKGHRVHIFRAVELFCMILS